MPAPIGTVNQLVAVIRSQLASRSETAKAKTRSSPDRGSARSGAHDAENLEALIGKRVREISKDDPNRGRKAFRVFLESIFLSQFGEQLINDPKFYQMIDDIQNTMEADPEVGELVDQAIQQLLSAA